MKYHATLYAPDGVRVSDARDSETIQQVWDRVNDFGSRWIFYPIAVVTDSDTGIIVEGFNDGMINTEILVGMTESDAGEYIKTNVKVITRTTSHEELSL